MLSLQAMRKVRIFVLGRDEERLVRVLGALGVVHLRSSVEESGGELQPEDVQAEMERCRDLQRRLEGLLAFVARQQHLQMATVAACAADGDIPRSQPPILRANRLWSAVRMLEQGMDRTVALNGAWIRRFGTNKRR